MRNLLTALLFAVANMAVAQNNGSYVGTVVAAWDPGGRIMTLVEPFAYIDPAGTRWDAPVGSKVDGASIPRFAWSIIGGPFEGKYRDASVIHDVACVERRRPWNAVHNVFYTAMLASGVDKVKAKTMYAAVYHFGPRWPTPQEVHYATSNTSEQRVCTPIPFGESVCITIPRTSQPIEGVIRVDVPPPPQTLTQETFKRLIATIEAGEASTQPLTPEQIREFK